MNLYNVRIKHLGTGIVYLQPFIANSADDAREKASDLLGYGVVDVKLIKTNV